TTRFTFNDGVTQNVVEYTLGIPGLCCLIGGGCAAAFDPTCTNAGGTFVPDGVCTSAQPCCLPTRQCQILDPLCCAAQNGTVLNSPDPCEGDTDSDGTDALCGDECPSDPAKLDPGVCGCGVSDTADADGDGVPDCTDQCPGADDAIFAPGCAVAIPATSQWGIMILALALGVAAKVRFGRARNRSLR
ncbi:MAG: IPTL-CTERM sorting domain-containing protein, partial [Planctomycetes bacterium]|nr:IPTL-CTERM sorting domain-containing protein [Planctomycetota bacterium]